MHVDPCFGSHDADTPGGLPHGGQRRNGLADPREIAKTDRGDIFRYTQPKLLSGLHGQTGPHHLHGGRDDAIVQSIALDQRRDEGFLKVGLDVTRPSARVCPMASPLFCEYHPAPFDGIFAHIQIVIDHARTG
jgi:hypothetical protein